MDEVQQQQQQQQAPWYQGKADAEMVGHWQNKGYKIEDAGEVAIAATKAAREAEKLIGAPPSQIIRLPTDPLKDADAMKAIWQRLGAPGDAKDYDFPALKDKDGKVTDTALDTVLRDTMAKNNVPKTMGTELAAAVAKFNLDKATEKAAADAAALVTENQTLAKNWGPNASQNMVVAKNAAAALGVKSEEVDALTKQIGYARVMEMFRNIGTKIGEDKFIRNDGGTGPAIATREQAQARITELKADKGFTKRYLDGDTAARREMGDLHKIVAGEEQVSLGGW